MTAFYKPSSTCQVPNLSTMWEAIFGQKTDGFFVEVGAYDGESFSNTSCLADVGWAGIYVEPILEFAERCRKRHAENPKVSVLNLAASDSIGVVDIFIGDSLTTLLPEQVEDYRKIDWAKRLHHGESRQVTTDLLDTILSEHDAPLEFDVLVVDVEGAEEKVMNGFEISKWRPKAILIELEDEHPDFRDNMRIVNSVAAVRSKISNAGYKIYFKDSINSLYLRNDVADMVEMRALAS